jgi:transposase-like protein
MRLDVVVRDNDGRKLDHRLWKRLRIRAVHQIQASAHPEDVATSLRMRRSTVFAWLAKFREDGGQHPRPATTVSPAVLLTRTQP